MATISLHMKVVFQPFVKNVDRIAEAKICWKGEECAKQCLAKVRQDLERNLRG